MRVAILSTPIVPHRWFCSRLGQPFETWAFFEEEPREPPGYEFAFRRQREHYERGLEAVTRKTYGESHYGKRLDSETVADLKSDNPAVIFVLGTLKLPPAFLDIAPIYNFHSGDPEHYRGLNNDFWTCWHRDWGRLGVCCHKVEAELDTGDWVGWKGVHRPGMRLWHLRRRKVEAAAELALAVVNNGKPLRARKYKPGRYYSAMPTILHHLADKRLKGST